MHKSRLAGFVIDCHGNDLGEAAAFWSQALGYDIRPSDNPEDDRYVLLDTGPNEVHIELQKVEHQSRVHLDIEADDIEAEVERLEGLGARRLEQIKTWWVMEAPSGHRFCVVKPQRDNFALEAKQWE